MCASVLLLYVCLVLNLSVRTVSHPSLAVKHWSLTSLIRPLLNHLSVCLTVCSLFSISSVALASIWAPHSPPPVLHQAYCTYPHIQQVPAASLSFYTLSVQLLWEEWVSTIELITAIQKLYLCLFTEQQRPGTCSPHLHTTTQPAYSQGTPHRVPHNYTPFC